MGAVGVTLAAPWVGHVFSVRGMGYPVTLGPEGPTFFALRRLGSPVLNYPTNYLLLGLMFVAVLLGWFRRERLIIALTLWAAVMLMLSTPRFAGGFMDTISVVISLYFPVAVVIGWLFIQIYAWSDRRAPMFRWVVWGVVGGLAVRGAVALCSIVEPAAAYVQANDLPAMAWIQEHTPPSARFMVNTYHWDFLPNYVIGFDAGYWLPMLAHRSTVTSPITYSIEHAKTPGFLADLGAVDRLGGHLTSPEALATLRSQGVTHVYVGEHGGPIAVDELLKSSAFELVYRKGAVYVFQMVETE